MVHRWLRPACQPQVTAQTNRLPETTKTMCLRPSPGRTTPTFTRRAWLALMEASRALQTLFSCLWGGFSWVPTLMRIHGFHLSLSIACRLGSLFLFYRREN